MTRTQRDLKTSNNFAKTPLAIIAALSILLCTYHANAQSELITVDSFDKIVVSPHIEVVFKEGDEASVRIEEISVPMEKLNVSVENKKLHLFLDGAKVTSPSITEQVNGNTCTTDVYDDLVVKAVVTYERLESIDLRGEQQFVFESKIERREFRMKIFGESQVLFKDVDITDLHVSMYGESSLEIASGKVENQTYRVYGESEVNTLGVENEDTKVTVYGEGEFQLTVSDNLIVTSYGEATIEYAGEARLQKRIIIGETEITRIERISSTDKWYDF